MPGQFVKNGAETMTELLTAAQMRAIEAAAIASGEVTGLELMERAGRGVVEAIFEEWPELQQTSHRAVVLCGPGNNGGDGFVVARLLKEWGWEVEVFLYGDPEKLPPDARVNYERWCGMGEVRSLELFDPEQYSPDLRTGEPTRTWIIDALFGTGLPAPDGWKALQQSVPKSLAEPSWDTEPAIGFRGYSTAVFVPTRGKELGVSLSLQN